MYKATDIEVAPTKGGDIFDRYEMPLTNDDLDIDFFTRQDFGCVFHERPVKPAPAAPG